LPRSRRRPYSSVPLSLRTDGPDEAISVSRHLTHSCCCRVVRRDRRRPPADGDGRARTPRAPPTEVDDPAAARTAYFLPRTAVRKEREDFEVSLGARDFVPGPTRGRPPLYAYRNIWSEALRRREIHLRTDRECRRRRRRCRDDRRRRLRARLPSAAGSTRPQFTLVPVRITTTRTTTTRTTTCVFT